MRDDEERDTEPCHPSFDEDYGDGESCGGIIFGDGRFAGSPPAVSGAAVVSFPRPAATGFPLPD